MSSDERIVCMTNPEKIVFEQVIYEHLKTLAEEMNVRLFCDAPWPMGVVMQVEKIAITSIEYPTSAKTEKQKEKRFERIGAFIKKKIFRKKGFLWQSQNSLRD